MGLPDWIRNNKMPQFSFREDPLTGAIYVDFLESEFPFAFTEAENDARWYMPGETVTIQNFTLTGGLIYVGTALMSLDSYRGEPSLIDPSLKIASKTTAKPLHYPRSYADLTPAERATYLTWLSTGRKNPSIDIQYVFLYLFGLERRVLDDQDEEADIVAGIPTIHAEVARLLEVYGPENDSFYDQASGFLGILGLMLPPPEVFFPPPPPPLLADRWEVPTEVAVTIGQFTANKIPVPPEWALAWVWYHPSTRPRTPAVRCKEEFAQLFKIRYSNEHGQGIKVRQGKARLRIIYEPANFSMAYVPIRFETIPNAFEQKGPVRKLQNIFYDVTFELDAYSRWIGRNPDSKGTLDALAHLPPPLIDSNHSASKTFIKWAEVHLAKGDSVRIPGAAVIALWLGNDADKLTNAQSKAFLDLAHRLGFGFEPDVRLGGPAITARAPAVLFRISPHSPVTIDPSYGVATTIVHLTAAVAAADGEISRRDVDHLGKQLVSHLELPEADQSRLFAHLLWLAGTDIKLTGLKRRIESYTDTQRGAIGDLLVAFAASDGLVSPKEVSMLIKVFRLLGLDPDTVTHRIHSTLASGGSGPTRATSGSTTSKGFDLDPAAIERIQSETAAVSSLLSDIFVDDETPSSTAPITPEEPNDNDIAFQGMDLPHARLLAALGAREQWPRPEFEELASQFHVMPGGAIDVINDAAFDIIGDPVIEGDDILTINIDLIEELKV